MSDKINLLPPHTVKYRMMTLAETVNYGHRVHNIPEKWKLTKGEGVVVSIIDTGLPVHRDLENQIIDYANFTDSPVEDLVSGHGSHTAGIVAAEENGEGVVGIAPKSKLLIAKALGDDGSGSDEWLAKAIYWSIEKGADIVNMSLGAPAEYEIAFRKTKEAIVFGYEKGVIFVCAAGNEYADRIGVPARYKETFSVMAVNANKEKGEFSNKGPLQDFAAVGVDVLSTYRENTYASLTGSSMACPQIAGICALILAEHRNNSETRTPINNPEDMRDHVRKICIDLGDKGYDYDFGDGLPVFGTINKEDPALPPVEPLEPIPQIGCWLLRFLKRIFKG